MVKASRSSLFCAEAGLSASRSIITLNHATWPLVLDADLTNNPPWYPIRGSIDSDPDDDFEVTIRDNDDELPPTLNDPTRDIDLQVFAVARCIKNANASREIVELLQVAGGGHLYRNQAGGGAAGTGNQNQPAP